MQNKAIMVASEFAFQGAAVINGARYATDASPDLIEYNETGFRC